MESRNVLFDKKDIVLVEDFIFNRDFSSAIIDRVQVLKNRSAKKLHDNIVDHYKYCIIEYNVKKIYNSYVSALRKYLNYINGHFYSNTLTLDYIF